MSEQRHSHKGQKGSECSSRVHKLALHVAHTFARFTPHACGMAALTNSVDAAYMPRRACTSDAGVHRWCGGPVVKRRRHLGGKYHIRLVASGRSGRHCGSVNRTRLALLLALASGAPAARLSAQCSDGSPPPCGRPAARPAPPAANSVAVLFFAARDTADAYLADGLTEDLTSLLGRVATVQVKAPGVVRRAQRASPDNAPAIARALGVRFLVDGNVRRVGTRVRVATRLLTGATAVAAWGDVFDRTPEELLALPSVIAREVAMRVGGGGPAPSSETAALGTLRTRSPAAYDHYLRGNFFLALRSPAGTARALAEYREAERLDSGFAAAIGRAAYAHAIARANTYRLPDAPIESLAVRGLAVADPAPSPGSN